MSVVRIARRRFCELKSQWQNEHPFENSVNSSEMPDKANILASW